MKLLSFNNGLLCGMNCRHHRYRPAHPFLGSNRCHRLAAQASSSQERGLSDPYVDAAHRLQQLINGVGDGEEELYYNMLLEEEPVNKLQVNAVLGAIVLTASSTICWLCGADPAGGASISWNSLTAAAVGAAAAVPLVAYKYISWSSETHKENPTVGSLHRALVDNSKPWLSDMNKGQLALHVVLDTLPILFLMLPAAQAGLTTSFSWTSAALGRSTGAWLPEEVGFALALFMTAVVSGAVKTTELMADPEQVTVVGDAVANADRYYRLMASSSSSSSSSNREADAQRAARAFKAVAVSWRELEQQMTSLYATLQVLDFMYLGVLWYLTKDMTAPCVAALLANAVDYHYMWNSIKQGGSGGGVGGHKQQRRSRGQTQRE